MRVSFLWVCVCVLYYDMYRCNSISGMAHLTPSLPVPRDFYATTFLFPIVRGCGHLGSRPVNTFPYRATVSDYALAHITYRNPKPPFSSDRRPWSSRRILYRGETRSLSFFFFFLSLSLSFVFVRLVD